MDTVVYNEDGSYVKCESSDGVDPKTGEPCKKFKITTHNADGTPNGSIMNLRWEKDGDVVQYTAEPFNITEESLGTLLGGLSTLGDKTENDSIYQIVDEMPQYPGGEKVMMEYVAKNVKYPQEAKDKEIQGRVFVSFVVEKDGSVSTVKVLRGIGGGCDEEAVRVVSSMPKWKPGIKDGKPVRVSYMMPLNFKLTEGQPAKPSKKADANKPDMKPDKDGVYQIVEEMPRFPGDEKALMEYLKSNLQMPEKYKGDDAEFRLAEYRTFIRFVVTEDGSISDVNLIKKTEGFKDLDDEALRVVKAMPKWEPGKMGGKPVKVYFHLPVVFKFKK
jgi:TonB family protein